MVGLHSHGHDDGELALTIDSQGIGGSGEAELEGKGEKTRLHKESAVYMGPEDVFTFTAVEACRYVVAGGHPEPHH